MPKATPSSEHLTEAELEQLGERLGAALVPGAVVYLEGELGVGKTTLARAICRGARADGRATSPTFALVHRYEGAIGPVYHVDCYRLRDPDEAQDLDFGTMLREHAAILVEWPEKAGAWAPPATSRIRLAHTDDPARRAVEVW